MALKNIDIWIIILCESYSNPFTSTESIRLIKRDASHSSTIVSRNPATPEVHATPWPLPLPQLDPDCVGQWPRGPPPRPPHPPATSLTPLDRGQRHHGLDIVATVLLDRWSPSVIRPSTALLCIIVLNYCLFSVGS